MRWQGRRQSRNIEDRRGQSPGRGAALGGGTAIIALVLALLFGVDLNDFTGGSGPATDPQAGIPAQTPNGAPDDEAGQFIATILASTEDTWTYLFADGGQRYRPPTLVLYDGAVQSACGFNSAATGPFYCPPDQKVYLDLSFFRELARLGASGEFAAAYVVAHEVGHHLQRITGIEQQMRQLQQRARTQADVNALSVRLELQADCFAGVWGHYAQQENMLERGEVQQGLDAAAAVGDDHLLRQAGQPVQPERFTHGTSQQRMEWFRRGFDSGNPDTCDTFGGF